jgi:hypothetical protein
MMIPCLKGMLQEFEQTFSLVAPRLFLESEHGLLDRRSVTSARVDSFSLRKTSTTDSPMLRE